MADPTVASTISMLASVQAAIAALESGQISNYAIDGQTVGYHDLAKLYAREKELLQRYSREQGLRPKCSYATLSME